MVPWVGLQCMIVVIPDYTHLLFGSHGMVGRNYLGKYDALLHTKYRSCWSHGFREDENVSFPFYKSIKANDPHDEAYMDPKGMVGRL